MPRRSLYTVFAVFLAALTLAGAASAYDRAPFMMYSLTPDGWGQSTTTAELKLHHRFPGIGPMFCQGVGMRGWPETEWSWVHGLTRYWDKLICFGSASGNVFGLVYDAKGAGSESWIMYRLKGATLRDLYGG